MTLSTVTTKGQSTIPEEIRLRLGIQPGDKILYKNADPKNRRFTAEVITTTNIVEKLAGSLNPKRKISYTPLKIVREKSGNLLGKKYSITK